MFEGAPMPPRLLRTSEAGRFLGLSGRTLEKHRTYGTGPTYRKIGGRVVYAIDDLQSWADQGVLMLNTTMTVERANANAHKDKGWQFFTDRIIELVSERQPHLVFMLWGAHAQSKQKLIDATKHLVLTSVHPSPLSAYRGFLGCGHFGRTNKFLEQNGETPIEWRLPPV